MDLLIYRKCYEENWFSNTKLSPTVEDLTKFEQDLSIMIKTNDFKLVSNSF